MLDKKETTNHISTGNVRKPQSEQGGRSREAKLKQYGESKGVFKISRPARKKKEGAGPRGSRNLPS